jgi:cyclopropane fatty-acyl-phospholipid synthase-like methyltransferase
MAISLDAQANDTSKRPRDNHTKGALAAPGGLRHPPAKERASPPSMPASAMFERQKPFSLACEENQGPILSVLQTHLAEARSLLEIGSGTGQHAAFFAAHFHGLTWQASDMAENLPGIALWTSEANLPNLPPPIALDVTGPWPAGPFDAVFSANTAHIMSTEGVAAMFQGVARVLPPGGIFALYGPFSYHGRHTSESNKRFDLWLKARDPKSGVRDFDMVNGLAEAGGLALKRDHEMPVNNRTLVWTRIVPGAQAS